MKLYTIGFTQKSAEEFFELLKQNNVDRIIDVRLNNNSHLASFAKKEHLVYFLKEICNISYYHYKFLAPKEETLKDYKNNEISWQKYKDDFKNTLKSRDIMNLVNFDVINNACLLCSEPTSDKCHRRLVAEYISSLVNKEAEIVHL